MVKKEETFHRIGYLYNQFSRPKSKVKTENGRYTDTRLVKIRVSETKE